MVVTPPPSISGIAATRSSRRSTNDTIAAVVGYRSGGMPSRIVIMLEVSTPRSRRYRTMKLRIMKPAPASKTSVSARSPTMRALAQRRARIPPPERPPSFKTSLTSVFETCSAGASPKMTAVSTQTTARKTNTTGSNVNAQ